MPKKPVNSNMTPEQFKHVRLARGMTQLEYANLLGVCLRTVVYYEAEGRPIPLPLVKILGLTDQT